MVIPQTEIIVTREGAEIARKTVGPGDYVIGRDAECELPLDVDLVSQRHAQLTVNYDHALIEDLGSDSGTFVNGKAVTEATRLWPNQKIQVGAATIELRRVKTASSPDHSLAPQTAAVRSMLPEEFLRDKKYAIGGVVAQGGMGAILDAQEATTERTVAMKVMLDGSSPEDLTRFVSEAKVTAQLEHPNIVPVHELSVDENDQIFYTMKFVHGITLKKVLEEMAAGTKLTIAKYPLGTLLTVFQKLCDAVAFAHSKGVLHRDLKPENIMVGDFGEVLLMDWGLAKVLGQREAVGVSVREPLDGSASATMAGSIMGTPQYMAPEQARGEVETMDQRADIYALGAILYHLLALRPSVTGGDAMAIVEKVARGEIEPLQGEGAPPPRGSASTGRGRPFSLNIPESLAAVVGEAMAFDKAKRYASVADLQADITAFQNGFATSAEHAGVLKQLALLIKRNKGIFTTAAAAWLLLTVLGVWFVLNLRASERATARQTEIAKANEQTAKAEAERATKAEADAIEKEESARQSLAKAALNLAEAAQREGNGPEMQAALNEVPDDLRDSTWNYLLAQSDDSIARVGSGNRDIDDVAAHPKRPGVFAVAARQNRIALIEVRTGVHLMDFKADFPPQASWAYYRVAISPDGERIAVGRDKDGGIVIHNARDGKKLIGWEAPATGHLEFSSDGKLLLQSHVSGHGLSMWDSATGQLRWLYEPKAAAAVGMLTPDGQQVLLRSFYEPLRLVNAQDGMLLRPLGKAKPSAFAIHPDGKMVVAGFDDGRIQGLNMEDGSVLFEFRAESRIIRHLAFTPNGARFVSVNPLADGRQSLRLWDATTGAPVHSLLGGSGPITGVSVHPLSGELLVSGPNARVWNLTGTPEKWTLPAPPNADIAFWGSDDMAFAPASNFPFAFVKLQAGTPATLWKGSQGDRKVSVSADGRSAVVGRSRQEPIVLLRNPGSTVEQVAAIKAKYSDNYLRLSPNGDRLLVGEGKGTKVEFFDTATGAQPVSLEKEEVKLFRDLGWLSSQRIVGLVVAKADRGTADSEERVVLWDAGTGKILQTVTNRSAMDVLAVAPDGHRFAEAGADKCVRIRDAETLAVQQEFRAHDGPITALAWHPTKPIIATGSADLSIRLWNIETGRRLEDLHGPLGAPSTLAFSLSGQRLGCSGADHFIRIWDPKSLSDQPDPDKADGWEDLLAPLTPAFVAQTGNGWRMDNGVISSANKKFAVLPLSGNFANTSYQVRVKLRQLGAKDSFRLGLPVADHSVGFALDGWPLFDHYTGLTKVDGKQAKDLPDAVHGKQVQDSEQHELEVTVRLEGTNAKITTTLDAQPLYEWTGPIAALKEDDKWVTFPLGTLTLGTMAADWVVYEVKAKRLEK